MTLFGLLASIGGFVKVRYLHDKADIDDFTFRLHYRLTSAFFFAVCVIITAFDSFGRPIECVTNEPFPRIDALNTYCWTQGTFTLAVQPSDLLSASRSFIHPGVGPELDSHEKVYHSYYQWVPFVLFLQGILFYLPHWIWKHFEGGRIGAMTEGSRGIQLGDDESHHNRCADLAKYLMATMNHYNHLMYVYVLCEILNFANVVGNIYFINEFLNGAFLTYGTQVIKLSEQDQSTRKDPMIEIFPRMTKCTFHQYGPSGSIVSRDALCLLPLNIAHEKIFIFMWFWLVFLAFVTGLTLIYRLVIVTVPSVRLYRMRRLASSGLAMTDAVVRRLPNSHYFFLCMLGRNFKGFLFSKLIEELAALMSPLISGRVMQRHQPSKPADWVAPIPTAPYPTGTLISNVYHPMMAPITKFKTVD